MLKSGKIASIPRSPYFAAFSKIQIKYQLTFKSVEIYNMFYSSLILCYDIGIRIHEWILILFVVCWNWGKWRRFRAHLILSHFQKLKLNIIQVPNRLKLESCINNCLYFALMSKWFKAMDLNKSCDVIKSTIIAMIQRLRRFSHFQKFKLNIN